MDLIKNDLDLAPRSVVLTAARNFAAALAETPQFIAFEQAADRFQQDQEAQQITQAYQQKQHASEAFINYQQAESLLQQDQEARTLLAKLAQTQARLRKTQANDGVMPAEIATLRELQGQVQRNRTLTVYAQTQQEAVNFLREVNAEISQLLGFNFAAFANHATC